MKGNIRVFCRLKPLNNQDEQCINIYNNAEITIKNDQKQNKYEFDIVFDQDITQKGIFDQIQYLIESFMDGFNVCIFAYGQTGSGKTYTMHGPKNNQGVFQRSIEEIFKIIEERKSNFEYQTCISMFEIYNEKIIDLLDNQIDKKLEIRQGQKRLYVQNLKIINVDSAMKVANYMEQGIQNRQTGKTNSNEYSSRSHLIYQIQIKGASLDNKYSFESQLSLIDLAGKFINIKGSERISKSKVEGEQLKESIHINKSLSSLSDVLQAKFNKYNFVNYRNSQLTYLLSDDLQGDSKVAVILQITQSIKDYDESLSSLKFGERIKMVEIGTPKIQKRQTFAILPGLKQL